MTLQEYMDEQGLKDHDLVDRLKVGRSMVTKLRHRAAKPSFDVAQRILAMSNGLVSMSELAPLARDRSDTSNGAAA